MMLMRLIRWVLIPVSLFYGLIVEIRNLCYGRRLFPVKKFPVPVLSIGNISAGGTGKTPLAIHLARTFLETKRVAVVSRGYGRSTRGVRLVSDGQNMLLGANQAGDEPALIARKTRGAVVIVAEKRIDGIQVAIDTFHPDVIILDDAFQHRAVFRELDLVLLNHREVNDRKLPLPSGRLREFYHNIKRADMILVTNLDDGQCARLSNFGKISTYSSMPYLENLLDHTFQPAGTIAQTEGQSIFAFCGIAHPDVFFKLLQDSGLNVKKSKPFSDHYDYSEEDIRGIISEADQAGCDRIICTEKDLVKIHDLGMSGIEKVFAAELNLKIRDEQRFVKEVESYIDKI